jgi:hypothetical protein
MNKKRSVFLFLMGCLLVWGVGCGDAIPRGPSDEDLLEMTFDQKDQAMKKMMKQHPQTLLTEEEMQKEVERMRQVVKEGTVEHTAELHLENYDGKGEARIVKFENAYFLTLSEDFLVEAGPYHVVELSPYAVPRNASEMENPKTIHLGLLKSNRGGQVYEIPEGADLSQIKSAVIYNKPFKTIFILGAFIP